MLDSFCHYLVYIVFINKIQSRRYAELYKKCNQQAALQIVEEKNAHQDERTIDLHELHVVEALTCLESFIVENVRGMTIFSSVGCNGKYHRIYAFHSNENSISVDKND